MTIAVMALLILLAALAQSLAPAVYMLGAAKLPFLLGVPVYYALTHRRGVVVASALLAGIVQDSLSPLPVGFSALSMVIFGLAVHHMREVLFRDSPLTVAMLGFVLAGLGMLVMYVMLRMGADVVAVPLWWLGLKMGGNALLGLVAVPLVWVAAGFLERLAGIDIGGRA